MSEKLKELLEKINQEGVQQAGESAKAIELQAKKDAEKIIADAKNKAQSIVGDAKDTAEKTRKTGEIALKQASRDLILSLKDEIKRIFGKIVASETAKAVSSEDIVDLLGELIENYIKKGGASSDVTVLVKKEDLEKFKKTMLSKLKEKVKEGIEFKTSPNINAGFSISFDKGKSFFDFTDEALTEALYAYLNPELTKLLK
ncbi:MAG: hypothetical protein KKD11_00520 [Candidatus Omnitrophica bacterium]|nr:hypothetical protein [Candidatus Omnitrophota bacterium]